MNEQPNQKPNGTPQPKPKTPSREELDRLREWDQYRKSGAGQGIAETIEVEE